MGFIEILFVIFLICAAVCAFHIAFGPFNIPPKLIQIAAIIGFVILVVLILSYFGFIPNLRLK